MKQRSFRFVGALIGLAAICYSPSSLLAQVAPPQLAPGQVLQQFSVLGNSGVTGSTATGTMVAGDVGSSPTPAVTNFPPSTVTPGFTVRNLNGLNDPISDQARTDANAAFAFLAAQGPGMTIAPQLAGQVLNSGIFSVAAAADLSMNGVLTLNGPGIFIFQIGTALTANVGSSIAGTADPCNVFFRVGTSATLNGLSFRGNVFAGANITVGAGSNVTGRTIAGSVPGGTGAVTMAGAGGNTVGGCAGAVAPPGCPVVTVNPANLPGGVVGTPFNQTITATGGVAPFTFSVTGGVLPNGLTLSNAGVLSGTPTAQGTSNFTITARDANNCPGTRALSIVVGCPVITLSPAVLPTGTSGIPFNQTITAAGGAAPLTFTITSGTLPSGLSLSSTGVISGTPNTPGNFTFTITASDPNVCSGSRSVSIFVQTDPNIPTLDFAGLTVLVGLLACAGLFIMNKFST